MTLSGPTKLRSTNGNSWHMLPPHKHRIRSKGDYRLPRVRGVTRVSRWWADGGARRSWLCPSRARTIVTVVKRQVSTCRHSCHIQQSGSASTWYCVRVGWGLWPVVPSLTPILGWLRGFPRVRKRLVPPDGRLSGGAAAVLWLYSPRTRTIVTVVKRQVSTCRHSS